MREEACIRGVLGTDADNLTDEQLAALVRDLKRRQRERMRVNEGMSAADAINLEAGRLAQDLADQAKLERRNAALNVVRAREARAFIDQFDDAAVGIEALLAGSNKRVEGARVSVDSRTRAKEGQYLGGLLNDLKREGVLDFLKARLLDAKKGPLDDKIALELFELREGGKPGRSGSSDAQRAANVIHRYQELARSDQNRAGAFIRKMPGYIVAQSHDMFRIRDAGRELWMAKVMPLIDADKTFQGADPLSFLHAVYDELSAGIFYKADAVAIPLDMAGTVNVATQASQSRVLHFRDADAWIAYNEAFGMGSMIEAVAFGLKRAARNTALMETLGTNPRATFQRLIDGYKQASLGTEKEVAGLKSPRLMSMMDVADGTIDIPGDVGLAKFGAGARAFENMVKLGGAVLSSVPDIATAASELQFQGRGFLSGLGAHVSAFFESLPKGSARREIAERIGAGIDGMIGGILSRFSAADTLPGKMSKLQQFFFRANLLGWWTDAHETAFSTVMARDLAGLAGNAHGALPEQSRMVLSLFNIGEREWDVIRAHAVHRADDGRDYIVPDLLRDLPDDEMARLVDGPLTETKMAMARDRLETNLRAYYLDRTSYGVLKGGIRERFASTQGLRSGTAVGEAVRFMMQFKSYSVSFANKVFGRYGQEDKFWRVPGSLARMPWGEKRQAGQLILAMTALGYVSAVMKDVAKGQEPRDPTDPATFVAAMMQGGGLGIYGDYLFADYNRYGGSLSTALAGPLAGTISDGVAAVAATGRYLTGQREELPDNQIFAFFKNNTPFLNLFYSKAALDYLILYDVQEAISPGSLRRREKRLKEDSDRKFILPPSQDRVKLFTG